MEEGSAAEYYQHQELSANANVLGDEEDAPVGNVPVSFTTGPAGSGKTYRLKQILAADPSAGLMCATTGVAAVNLDAATLHSTLGFFDTESLTDKFISGYLTRKIVALSEDYRSLMVDEVSMFDGDALDIIYEATAQANQRTGRDFAIHLTGDFCQLPPVKAKWAFEAANWEHFARNMTRLEKIWRQDAGPFLDALNLARAGEGQQAAEAFRPLAKWAVALDTNFPGTTIVAKNDEVENYNRARYLKLAGAETRFASRRWGKQKGEWVWKPGRGTGIPDELRLKVGAYVMILTNDVPDFTYANGDCGTVEGFDHGFVLVKLARNGNVVAVPSITRLVESKDEPLSSESAGAYFDEKKQRWILGGITYVPVRLAYAATVHKTQGLTLDNVQIDIRGHFFGSENMAYVALSRARTAEGLRIVGSPETLARRIKLAGKVREWI